MKQVNLPYVQAKKVKGRTYYYFRKRSGDGEIRIKLPNNPDSKEFSDEYWKIRGGRSKVVKTNFKALIAHYRASPKFKRLKASTKTNYSRHLDSLIETSAAVDVCKVKRSHVISSRDKRSETSYSQANERVAVISNLMEQAIDLDWIKHNPAKGIEKLKGGEYEPWPKDKLEAFERYCERNDLNIERILYELAVGTGQRLNDCLAMKWEHFNGGYMSVVQEKTETRLDVYCPARLQRFLQKTTKQGEFILSKNLRQGFKKRTVQQRIQGIREEIGAKAYVIHGWRYNAAMELAEANCTDAQIQAVTGHKSLEMVIKYRNQASQRKLSKQAQEKR